MANENVIIINDDLRTMEIPKSITLLGVESDDDVNRIQFQMPKMYSGFDLSKFQARINYMNANGTGDVYIADDLAIDGDDPSLMNFSWLVGRTACAYKGETKFIVCLKLFDVDAKVIKEFNTTVYSLPVLEGLETTEIVVQQNPDIIEYILNMIEKAGSIDWSDYYTKAETDAQIQNAIPQVLPNPSALTINDVSYDGSVPVDIKIQSGETEKQVTVDGDLIHVEDAVPQEVDELVLYDSTGNPISAEIAIANKNLFRIDLLPEQTISNGITFAKNDDGSILASGTSTATYPATKCNLDPFMFKVGYTYTLSTGKTNGYLYAQLIMNYGDGSTEYIVSRNTSNTFTVEKPVTSCVASVQLTDSGITLANELIYPMLEVSETASAFVNNKYMTMNFDGTILPKLPDAISNLWANDSNVKNISMTYQADIIMGKINDYVRKNVQTSATLEVTHDGAGTVMISVG